MESATRSKRKEAVKGKEKTDDEEEQAQAGKKQRPGDTSSPSQAPSPKSGKRNQKAQDDSDEWKRMFFELMLYKANNNNLNVRSNDEDNAELYQWILQQRKQYKVFQKNKDSSSLTNDRITVLESVRFAFTTRGDDHWQRNYEKLKQFKSEHEHVLVPRLSETPGLGDWVISQRLQFKEWLHGRATPLTKQRKDLLDELGFVWQVRARPEWSSKFKELEAYKRKYGDTRVPQHWAENRTLGKWVAKQREQHKLLLNDKHSFLTADRLEQLNKIGFVWSVRGDVVLEDNEPSGKRESRDASSRRRIHAAV